MNKKVNVIGAGFSGLIIAYYLNRAGHEVSVFEKSETVGGLLKSLKSDFGFAEQAANGMVLTEDLLHLCKDLDIEIINPKAESKNKYIYFQSKKSKWPLGFFSTLNLMIKVFKFKINNDKFKPKENETLRSWGERVFSKGTVDALIEPAFLGVYASTSKNLSAKLVTKNFFNKKKKSNKVKRQTVSFDDGMQGFCLQMHKRLADRGVKFSFKCEKNELEDQAMSFVCTDFNSASSIFKTKFPQLSTDLKKINSISIAKMACYTEKLPSDGFGCLFARNEEISSLGVIFDSNLFAHNHEKTKLQTWLVGAEGCENSEQVRKTVIRDMNSFWKQDLVISHENIKIWKNKLPLYDLELENFLKKYDTMLPIYNNNYLFANYCGDLGLSQIISRAKNIIERV